VKARRAAAGLVGAALVLTLAGCPNEPAPPTAKTVPTPASVTEAIKSLCDFFVARAHETLRKPEAEGNVELFRGTPGFPADLIDRVGEREQKDSCLRVEPERTGSGPAVRKHGDP
jgi:hypothetical protein